MAKEKMVFFRPSLGGFNKNDVNSYIEKLNAEFAERERVLKRKIETLESKCAELDDANANLASANATISDLESKMDMQEKVITEYKDKNDLQAAEIESLTSEKLAFENEINQLSERIASLSDAICKSEKYDDISAQIGEIILSARQTAEGIVAKAERDAAAKFAAANEQLENAAAAFNARAATAAYSVKGQIKKMATDSYAKIASQTAETSDMLRALAEHIQSSSEYIDTVLSGSKSEIEDVISVESSKVFPDECRISFKNN